MTRRNRHIGGSFNARVILYKLSASALSKRGLKRKADTKPSSAPKRRKVTKTRKSRTKRKNTSKRKKSKKAKKSVRRSGAKKRKATKISSRRLSGDTRASLKNKPL